MRELTAQVRPLAHSGTALVCSRSAARLSHSAISGDIDERDTLRAGKRSGSGCALTGTYSRESVRRLYPGSSTQVGLRAPRPVIGRKQRFCHLWSLGGPAGILAPLAHRVEAPSRMAARSKVRTYNARGQSGLSWVGGRTATDPR